MRDAFSSTGNISKCPMPFFFLQSNGNTPGTADFSLAQRSTLSADDNLDKMTGTEFSRQTQFKKVTLFSSILSGTESLHLQNRSILLFFSSKIRSFISFNGKIASSAC